VRPPPVPQRSARVIVPQPLRSPPIVLSFAGTDPTSGAGLQADLLTLSAMGCHPISVVTALTIQDTVGVEAVEAVDPQSVVRQAEAVLKDMSANAFKIGLVASAENAQAIAHVVSAHSDVPVVLDPVLASGRGDRLAAEEVVDAIVRLLVPRATVLTPNSLEARRLVASGHPTLDDFPLSECASRLVDLGAKFVLITGTHAPTPDVVNTLYDSGGAVRTDRWKRLAGNFHGSGCTLASAIAAAIAHGLSIPDAVREAQEYTWETLARAFRPGAGQSIPWRFAWGRR
jgi:hydroxymethylpyrimidine/phosphomethylpyrimidine kinase